MPATRIKICGVTRAEDAQAAVRAGADAIGIIFHPASARHVSLDQARQIAGVIPAFVATVGVFVDADTLTIRDTLRQVHLSAVQLNGHESPDVVARLRPIPVIKSIRVDRVRLGDELQRWRQAIAKLDLTHLVGLVMDTGSSAGGSGIANDWDALARCASQGGLAALPAIIAAGGLRPETVADVIRLLRPWAVDVSSGVEGPIKRRKSAEKIHAFIDAVRQGDRS